MLVLAACRAPATPRQATPCEDAAAAITVATTTAGAEPAELPMAAIAAADARACADDRWSADAIACFRASEHESDLELCRTSLDEAQQRAWGLAMVRSLEPNAFTPDVGVGACDDYLRRFDVFVRCGHLTDTWRTAAVRALAPRVSAWQVVKHPMTPEARRRMVENECEQDLARLRDTAAEVRCTIEP